MLVTGEGWDATIEALTIAAVKFELLTTNNRSPVSSVIRNNVREKEVLLVVAVSQTIDENIFLYGFHRTGIR